MNIALVIASGMSFIAWGIHTFVGGPLIAKPLLDSKMKPVPKFTNYYCWHIVTLSLFAMASGFAYSAIMPNETTLATFLCILSASFMVWNLVLIIGSKCTVLELPQWLLFLAITAPAVIGITMS